MLIVISTFLSLRINFGDIVILILAGRVLEWW